MHNPDGDVRTLVGEARAAELSGATDRALTLYTALLDAEAGPSSLRADVLRWVGTIYRERGNHETASTYYARSVEEASVCRYAAGRAHALNCRAILSQRQGDVEEALPLYNEAAAEAASAEDNRLLGMIEQNLAVLHSTRGDLGMAILRYRMSLRAFEDFGDDEAVSWVLNNLGLTYRRRRQFAEAEAAYVRALELAARRGDSWTTCVLELNYADLLIDLGELSRAEELCGRALATATARQDLPRQAHAAKCRARLSGLRNDLAAAQADLLRALDLARASKDAFVTAEILTDLGAIRARAQEQPEAQQAWRQALEIFTRIGAQGEARDVADLLARARGEARATGASV